MWKIPGIPPVDDRAQSEAAARQQRLTKPAGSLGRLEQLSIQLAGIQGRAFPTCERAQVVVFAGDHGVAARGVSAYPQAVTAQMALNMAAGNAAINVLARQAGAGVQVVDVGIAGAVPAHPNLIAARLMDGTADFTQMPAMPIEICTQALGVGAELADKAANAGCSIFIAGDMGIANTTSAAALMAAYCRLDAEECCGRGTGVDDAGLARKRETVTLGLLRHKEALDDPLRTLACLGGLEIAAIAGAFLAAAGLRMAVVVDGFITGAAALAALRLQPDIAPYLLWSHCGAEHGHRRLLSEVGAQPLLQLGMRLGEGSGAALSLHLLRAACRTLAEMATFAQAGVSDKPAPAEVTEPVRK